MKVELLPEPELQFGLDRHIDIKFGLMNYRPIDFNHELAPKQIHVGMVGTQQTIDGLSAWLEHCRSEIPAKVSKQPHLFPKFPGFHKGEGFDSELVLNTQLHKTISPREFVRLTAGKERNAVITEAVELILAQIAELDKPNVHVIMCAPPMELLLAMLGENEQDEEEDEEESHLDFHDMLKARAMNLSKPLQVVLPMTYDKTKRRQQKFRPDRNRELQDEATRAWNIHTALYYKAGGTPWRMIREASEYMTCYVGVAFYKTLDGSKLMTSMAQVFNERGDGVIVRGGQASISKDDPQPHLNRDDAQALLDKALQTYRNEHFTFPARLVLHKTSSHSAAEVEGFSAAADAHHISMVDFVSLLRYAPLKLFRIGAYPPSRGTFWELEDKTHVLYTRGGVDFFETYPGLYVPTPLRIRCEQVEQTPKFIASEILALSKMNWNNTQFDGGEPITTRAAHRVGKILRYVEKDGYVRPLYSFYM